MHKPKFPEKGLQDMPCISGGKPSETGFRHLPEAQELRGKNEKKCEESAACDGPTLHAEGVRGVSGQGGPTLHALDLVVGGVGVAT